MPAHSRSSWLAVRGRGPDQGLLVLGSGDAGQGTGLGERDPAGRERAADGGQDFECVRDAQLLAGSRRRQAAAPRQPLRAGADPGAVPAAAGVEGGEQLEEPARRRGEVTGELGHLPLHRGHGQVGAIGRHAPNVRPAYDKTLAAQTIARCRLVATELGHSVPRLALSHGASNVLVFGSVARGEEAIGELLGIQVDVGPSDALREDICDRVLSEARAL